MRGTPLAEATVDPEPVILTEVDNRIGVITLNRPARRNALNGELIAALDGAVREMAEQSARWPRIPRRRS
jgi:enoyl-CoA hydratase/carnithine racemase